MKRLYCFESEAEMQAAIPAFGSNPIIVGDAFGPSGYYGKSIGVEDAENASNLPKDSQIKAYSYQGELSPNGPWIRR